MSRRSPLTTLAPNPSAGDSARVAATGQRPRRHRRQPVAPERQRPDGIETGVAGRGVGRHAHSVPPARDSGAERNARAPLAHGARRGGRGACRSAPA